MEWMCFHRWTSYAPGLAPPVLPSDVRCFVQEADLIQWRQNRVSLALFKGAWLLFQSLQTVLTLIHFHAIFSAQGQHLLGKVFLTNADYDLDLSTYLSIFSIFKTTGSLVELLRGFPKYALQEHVVGIMQVLDNIFKTYRTVKLIFNPAYSLIEVFLKAESN